MPVGMRFRGRYRCGEVIVAKRLKNELKYGPSGVGDVREFTSVLSLPPPKTSADRDAPYSLKFP